MEEEGRFVDAAKEGEEVYAEGVLGGGGRMKWWVWLIALLVGLLVLGLLCSGKPEGFLCNKWPFGDCRL